MASFITMDVFMDSGDFPILGFPSLVHFTLFLYPRILIPLARAQRAPGGLVLVIESKISSLNDGMWNPQGRMHPNSFTVKMSTIPTLAMIALIYTKISVLEYRILRWKSRFIIRAWDRVRGCTLVGIMNFPIRYTGLSDVLIFGVIQFWTIHPEVVMNKQIYFGFVMHLRRNYRMQGAWTLALSSLGIRQIRSHRQLLVTLPCLWSKQSIWFILHLFDIYTRVRGNRPRPSHGVHPPRAYSPRVFTNEDLKGKGIRKTVIYIVN